MSTSNIDMQQVHFRLRKDYISLKAKAIPQLAHVYNRKRKKTGVNEWCTYAWILFHPQSCLLQAWSIADTTGFLRERSFIFTVCPNIKVSIVILLITTL